MSQRDRERESERDHLSMVYLSHLATSLEREKVRSLFVRFFSMRERDLSMREPSEGREREGERERDGSGAGRGAWI